MNIGNKGIEDININENKKKKKLSFKLLIVLLIAVILIIIFVNRKTELNTKSQMYSIEKICELATLECYYHDVAEFRQEATGIFQIGYKKYWIEYNGIVKYGIDAKDIKVNKPDKNGVVKISIPEAKILSVNVDINSMSDPIVDTGLFTSISIEEKNKAYNKAQETMKLNAENDTRLLSQAKYNAQKLIEQFIINVGKQEDKEYSVEWIDN